jgi:uncharacterized protein YcfJ
MTDEQPDQDNATMGDVFNAVIGGMSKEQFQQLAARTGHTEVPPKQKAAEALAGLVRQGNIDANNLTPAQVLRKIQRRG